MRIDVSVKMNPTQKIIKRLGIDKSGDVQKFWTATVLRRIQRYMPFRTGETIRLTVAQTDINKPEIVTDVPYAQMLYHGKVMVDSKTGVAGFLTDDGWKSRKGSTKIPTGRDIQYTTTKNPEAGPYWDRRLKAAELPAMTKELQAYIDKKGGIM